MSEDIYEPIHKSRVRSLFEGAASRANRHIAAHFGDKIPMYCVAEYPRSGGTWLSSMMADYLRCAKPGLAVLPSTCRAVMHNHWRYHKKLRRTIYLVRDGRDVFVSLYFYSSRIHKLMLQRGHGNKKSWARLTRIFGNEISDVADDVGMKEFLKAEFEDPTVLRSTNWAQHIQMWHGSNGRPGMLYLRYEDLLDNPVGTLRTAVEHVSPIKASERLLQRSVDHFSMEAMTGRVSGDAEDGAFIRKGISGDWRNYFDGELAQEFDKYAGKELIHLGYEKDRQWVDECTSAVSVD